MKFDNINIQDRMWRFCEEVNKVGADVCILTDGYNIHYLSGYSGHEGMMLVAGKKYYILTDSRYTEQAGIEAPDFTIVDIASLGYSKTIAKILGELYEQKYNNNLKDTVINIGFENKNISYEQYKALVDNLTMYNCNFIELADKINSLRIIKNDEEIEYLSRAEKIGDEAFNHILSVLHPGMTELEVALELEIAMKKRGATAVSFDTIAAFGSNSSLPHAKVSDKKLEEGSFLTMDFGCIYNNYCSDMTRTVFIGENPSERQLLVYNTVLKAQQEALRVIKPGMKCNEVDRVARDVIKDAGFGDYFGHGLGHGVGLFIHEEPRFSPKCNDILKPGVVITVEPGIYLPGEFGVRIEDMVVITEDGYRNLTNSPKELIMIF